MESILLLGAVGAAVWMIADLPVYEAMYDRMPEAISLVKEEIGLLSIYPIAAFLLVFGPSQVADIAGTSFFLSLACAAVFLHNAQQTQMGTIKRDETMKSEPEAVLDEELEIDESKLVLAGN